MKFGFPILLLYESHRSYPSRRRLVSSIGMTVKSILSRLYPKGSTLMFLCGLILKGVQEFCMDKESGGPVIFLAQFVLAFYEETL